jgi:hypothetical protein
MNIILFIIPMMAITYTAVTLNIIVIIFCIITLKA